jgi:polyhydroxybutyrate depolymerase
LPEKKGSGAGLHFKEAKPRPLFHAASEKDPLVTIAMQRRTLDHVKKLNGCADQGEAWARGCLRCPSMDGTPVVIYLHDEGHKYPEAAPALIVKFFKEHTKK